MVKHVVAGTENGFVPLKHRHPHPVVGLRTGQRIGHVSVHR